MFGTGFRVSGYKFRFMGQGFVGFRMWIINQGYGTEFGVQGLACRVSAFKNLGARVKSVG